MRKWLPWLLLAAGICWAVENPHAASAAFRNIGLFLSLTAGGK